MRSPPTRLKKVGGTCAVSGYDRQLIQVANKWLTYVTGGAPYWILAEKRLRKSQKATKGRGAGGSPSSSRLNITDGGTCDSREPRTKRKKSAQVKAEPELLPTVNSRTATPAPTPERSGPWERAEKRLGVKVNKS